MVIKLKWNVGQKEYVILLYSCLNIKGMVTGIVLLLLLSFSFMILAAWALSLWEMHTSLPSYTFPFLQVSDQIAASPQSSFWPPDASSPENWRCWWCWCLSTKNSVMCFMPQVSLLLWQCHMPSSLSRLFLYLESIERVYVENMGNIPFCSTFFWEFIAYRALWEIKQLTGSHCFHPKCYWSIQSHHNSQELIQKYVNIFINIIWTLSNERTISDRRPERHIHSFIYSLIHPLI